MCLFVAIALFTVVALSSADNGDRCLLTQCQSQEGGVRLTRGASSPGMLRQAFAKVAERGLCKDIDDNQACHEKCTESKIAQQVASVGKKIKEKYCNDKQSEESFVQSVKGFIGALEEEHEKNKCDEMILWRIMKADEICRKTKACAFGKSFNAVKGNYEADVVEYVDAIAKAERVIVLDVLTDFNELPESCGFLYKPINEE